jgi:hypothetical protein
MLFSDLPMSIPLFVLLNLATFGLVGAIFWLIYRCPVPTLANPNLVIDVIRTAANAVGG